MTDPEAIGAVVDALNELGIRFMVVGSLSAAVYGRSRLTKDADLVVESAVYPSRLLAEMLGERFRVDPQMAFETATMTTKQVVEVVGSAFTIELFHLSDDDHDRARYNRRKLVDLLGRQIHVPTAEESS